MTEETKALNKKIFDALAKNTRPERLRQMLRIATDNALHSGSFIVRKTHHNDDTYIELTLVIRDTWTNNEICEAVPEVLDEHFGLKYICTSRVYAELPLNLDTDYTIITISAHGKVPLDIHTKYVEDTRDKLHQAITEAINQEMFVKQRFEFDDIRTKFKMDFNIELLGNNVFMYEHGISRNIKWYIQHNMIPHAAYGVDVEAYIINGNVVGNLAIERYTVGNING